MVLPPTPKISAKDIKLSTTIYPVVSQRLDPSAFPHPAKPGYAPATTIENTQHLLDGYGITANYNVISKKIAIKVPGHAGSPDNFDNVAMAYIISLAILNGMSTGKVPEFVMAIADRNQINPVTNWIESKPWDGVHRLPAFYDTLTCIEDFPDALKQTLMYRWLISAVAAGFKPSGFKCRGVLTLQGPQSIGKTAWVSALVPDEILREVLIKLDHHLDAANKDSIITAVEHWIVEVGELDSSLKKDVARLKGFLTNDRDKLRRPYARTNSEYPRKTVFCATVNDANFLVDSTGNTRFWTIPVTSVNFNHGIDMQQLFAQVTVEFNNDVQWWLTKDEEVRLEDYNKRHRTISAIEESILAVLDLDRVNGEMLPAMTASQMLKEVDINPTNPKCKEAAAVLREHLGDSKRINGQNKWRIPLKKDRLHPSSTSIEKVPEEDMY